MSSSEPAGDTIASPCILQCRVDQVSGFCSGCYRTLDEISFWHRMTSAQRAAVLADIRLRRARAGGGESA
jgi:predicted Fe-S protein YdhL (DUF1289 family)